jgi:carbon starvation protein
MLTEGAVSSLAVILPAAIVWDFSAFAANAGLTTDVLLKAGINVTKTPVITSLGAVPRFTTSYGLVQALVWSRLTGGDFVAYLQGLLNFRCVGTNGICTNHTGYC